MKNFSVFDIIGPRMVGPSSSHTAGAVRIGLIAHALIAGHSSGYAGDVEDRNTDCNAYIADEGENANGAVGCGIMSSGVGIVDENEKSYHERREVMSQRKSRNSSAVHRIASAEITLYGSFAETGRGHGTDRAIIAGILGVEPDDARVKYSMLLAKSENINITVNYSQEETTHPNTARVRITGDDGRKFEIVGVSIGGGNIEIVEINGMEVSFSGDLPALIAFYRDTPGIITKVTGILADEGINVAFMKVFRSAKRQGACMVIETDAAINHELLASIKRSVEEIDEVCSI